MTYNVSRIALRQNLLYKTGWDSWSRGLNMITTLSVQCVHIATGERGHPPASVGAVCATRPEGCDCVSAMESSESAREDLAVMHGCGLSPPSSAPPARQPEPQSVRPRPPRDAARLHDRLPRWPVPGLAAWEPAPAGIPLQLLRGPLPGRHVRGPLLPGHRRDRAHSPGAASLSTAYLGRGRAAGRVASRGFGATWWSRRRRVAATGSWNLSTPQCHRRGSIRLGFSVLPLNPSVTHRHSSSLIATHRYSQFALRGLRLAGPARLAVHAGLGRGRHSAHTNLESTRRLGAEPAQLRCSPSCMPRSRIAARIPPRPADCSRCCLRSGRLPTPARAAAPHRSDSHGRWPT